MLRVGFLLGPNFTLSAMSLFIDVLSTAGNMQAGTARASWTIMSSTGNHVRSSCGIWISPTSAMLAPQQFDYIVVITGASQFATVDQALLRYLQSASRANVKIVGICGGTFVLAAAGLLAGRRSCISWFNHDAFKSAFPTLAVDCHHLYLEDSKIMTCAGGSAVADMATAVLRRHLGPPAEKNSLEMLLIERRRRWNDIQPRTPLAVSHKDPRINAALIFMENNIEDEFDVAGVAASMSLSRRQMERLFRLELAMSPTQVLLKLRLERARGLLLGTRKPLLEVAFDSGFRNPSHFTRRFRQAYGQTPSQIRKARA